MRDITTLQKALSSLFLISAIACGDPAGIELVVSGAASLTDALIDIEAAFEAANPGVDVVLNLGSTSSLRQQILEGAPVDVFASADFANMELVVAAGEAKDSVVFANNSLQIAVPAGNPAGINGLEDFAAEELLIGLCAENIPCGRFAREALVNAGVTPAVDSNEPDVRALLTKIAAGELDAGITYVTDVLSAEGKIEGIDIPPAVNVATSYPIATLAGAPNPAAASAFVTFVLSVEGQTMLARHGFSAP